MKLLSVAFVIFAIVMSKSFGTTGKPLLPVDRFAVDTLATGLIVPWEIVFMPDETMLFTERNGKVRLYRNNRLEEKSVLRIADIDTTKKMGLLGICLHPAFTKNNYCYLAYNYRKEGK
ncbi:MAG TPA: PQQ-dependent sugar dehydrogenase, partial [Flavisolibacter sp.]|nr:PQQ-dependent sugar dehydrogenase [Flavisolibacter sp.]